MSTTDTISKPVPVLTPPLKWVGGKRWLLPHLRALWEGHEDARLVEPFCGGLSVALGLCPKEAVLNDANPYAVNFYKWLQRGLKVSIPMANDSELYYRHREAFNHLASRRRYHVKRAAELFYYLNRTGFNGLCRFNRSGQYNVPFGRYSKITYQRDFSGFPRLFRKWHFSHGDFGKMSWKPGDFIYADPPYDDSFTQYSTEGFDWEDQVRLADKLAQHEGPVVVSNRATPRIVSLYRKLGFEVSELNAPRRIACTGDRTPCLEMLATRNL